MKPGIPTGQSVRLLGGTRWEENHFPAVLGKAMPGGLGAAESMVIPDRLPFLMP